MSDPSRDRRLSPLDANAGHAADATLSPPGSLGRTQIITTESQLFESFPEAAAAVATAAGGANSNAGGEFGHVASIRSSPVPSRPHGATGESRTEQTTAVPALELHEMDPTFDYHAEKTIQSVESGIARSRKLPLTQTLVSRHRHRRTFVTLHSTGMKRIWPMALAQPLLLQARRLALIRPSSTLGKRLEHPKSV